MKWILLTLLFSCASNYRAINPTRMSKGNPVYSSSERLGEMTILKSTGKDLHVIIKNTSDQPLNIDLNLATQKLKSEKKTSEAESFWHDFCGTKEEGCEDPRVTLKSKETIEVHWNFSNYGMGRFNLPLKKNEGIADVFNIQFQSL